jgi:hypothetical protein
VVNAVWFTVLIISGLADPSGAIGKTGERPGIQTGVCETILPGPFVWFLAVAQARQ